MPSESKTSAERDMDPISEALSAAAAAVAAVVIAAKGRPLRSIREGVDEIAIDRSLLAVVRETEWRMKAEMPATAPIDDTASFEGLDDVEVAVYIDPPALVSDAMDDGAPSMQDPPSRAVSVHGPGPAEADGLDAKALVSRLAEKKTQVEESSYFDLMEIGPSASESAIREAYFRLRGEFAIERFSGADLSGLRGDAEMVLSVLEEAYAVLSDPPMKEAYRSAIGGGGRGD